MKLLQFVDPIQRYILTNMISIGSLIVLLEKKKEKKKTKKKQKKKTRNRHKNKIKKQT